MSGRITTLTAAPLLAALALALSASLAMPRETDAWRGWTPVLVRYGAPLDQVVLVLEEAGVMPVWSELSQTVYLTDFVTSRRIPLEEARRRLLPEDPRRTPWIDGLERYFRAREGASIWGMLYVRDAKASAARRALSRSAFSEDWTIPDAGGSTSSFPSWVPGLLLTGWAAWTWRKGRAFAVLAAVPWLPLWAAGPPAAVLAGIFGYIAFLSLGSEDGMEPGRITVPPGLPALSRALPAGISAVFFLVADTAVLPAALLSAASAAGLAVALDNLYRCREKRFVHTVFRGPPLDPTRLARRLDAAQGRRTLAGFAAAVFSLAAPAATGVLGGEPEVGEGFLLPVPVHEKSGISGPASAEDIERMAGDDAAQYFPNLADAVAHRAFQAALPYSRLGTRNFGSLAPVVLERFVPDGDAVELIKETTAEFGNAWVRSAIREEKKAGIGAVLADQGGFTVVELRAVDTLRSGWSLAPKGFFLYIILFAPAGGIFLVPLLRKSRILTQSRGAARR